MVHPGRDIEFLQVTYLHDDLLCQRISSQWDFSLRLEFICCKLTGCADFVLFQTTDPIWLAVISQTIWFRKRRQELSKTWYLFTSSPRCVPHHDIWSHMYQWASPVDSRGCPRVPSCWIPPDPISLSPGKKNQHRKFGGTQVVRKGIFQRIL